MTQEDILRSVISAAAADAFLPHLNGGGLTLKGQLPVREIEVSAKVVFDDLAFVRPPRLLLSDTSRLPRKILPHLDADGELCAVDRDLFVLDRYNAGAQVRGLLAKARQVIEAGLTKAATGEIAAEFPRHWSSDWIGIEGNAVEGPACVGSTPNMTIIKPAADGKEAWIVRTERQLSFEADQDRPSTLGGLLEWAGRWDPNLPTRLIRALALIPRLDAMVALHAPNGIAVAQLDLKSKGPVFERAHGRKAGWPKLVTSVGALGWPITRYHGRRVDLEYVLGLNGEEHAALAGKRITLVGCGAIGGYLSRMLAQNGAGLSGGVLALIDPDRLDHLNIRRHALGHTSIGSEKAPSCKEMIDRDFPGLSVIARTAAVQLQVGLFEGADLVVDATGEQGISEFLNTWMIERQKGGEVLPCLLHTSIEGAGLSARSFISSNERYACLRCLQPDHEGAPRFSAVVGQLEEPVAPCGEQPITRYGPAAPMAAAVLAAQHAVDWAEGHEMPLLRTIRLIREGTREVRPTNPKAKSRCPACTRAH
ncbi:MAG: hypothetical protein QOD42_1740 [Sphingomonadales bacterium]|nr:hypothetical protein [Sphingomonadales bacterium]